MILCGETLNLGGSGVLVRGDGDFESLVLVVSDLSATAGLALGLEAVLLTCDGDVDLSFEEFCCVCTLADTLDLDLLRADI